MAPEQARGEVLDHRADLFSLASVLYQMTSGRPPFRASNTVAVLKRVCEDTPRPIQDVIAGTPDWLCTIINRLLEKDPAKRFQTAKEVSDLFARCQAELQLNGKVTCVQSSHLAPRDEPPTAAPPSSSRPSPNPPASQSAVVQPSAAQSSHHAPRDEPSTAPLHPPSPNRPSPNPGTSPNAAVQPGAVPKSSSRGAMTATLKRPLLLIGSILAVVAIIAIVINNSRQGNDPASGERQLSGTPSEISNLKSHTSNPASEPTPDVPPMDALPIVATTPSAPASDPSTSPPNASPPSGC